jgi:hypothetical protein
VDTHCLAPGQRPWGPSSVDANDSKTMMTFKMLGLRSLPRLFCKGFTRGPASDELVGWEPGHQTADPLRRTSRRLLGGVAQRDNFDGCCGGGPLRGSWCAACWAFNL